MSLRERLRDPVVVDWLPVALLPPVLVVDAAFCPEGPSVSAIGILSAFVGCLPLAWRRRLSFLRIAPFLVAGIVLVLALLRPSDAVVLIPVVALVTLALDGTRRSTARTGLAVVPCVLVSVVPFASDAADFAQVVVRNLLLCLLALAAGDVLRSRREAAERSAAATEEEARRRVGEERLRIAREVHDVMAHAMVAINVQAGVAAHLLDGDREQARRALREIKARSGEALTDLRATLGLLRDADVTVPVSPAARLEELDDLAASLRAAGVDVTLDLGRLDDVPAAVHLAGYRIVQEALTNVLRHAGATAVDVAVRPEGGEVVVRVVDDGGAVDASGGGTGNGVRGMRERARLLGGDLEAGPVPGGGWRVAARLPLAAAATS